VDCKILLFELPENKFGPSRNRAAILHKVIFL